MRISSVQANEGQFINFRLEDQELESLFRGQTKPDDYCVQIFGTWDTVLYVQPTAPVNGKFGNSKRQPTGSAIKYKLTAPLGANGHRTTFKTQAWRLGAPEQYIAPVDCPTMLSMREHVPTLSVRPLDYIHLVPGGPPTKAPPSKAVPVQAREMAVMPTEDELTRAVQAVDMLNGLKKKYGGTFQFVIESDHQNGQRLVMHRAEVVYKPINRGV